MAGYSGKPLIEKLGITPDTVVTAINPPGSYADLAGLPAEPAILGAGDPMPDDLRFVHIFATRRSELDRWLGAARKALVPSGMVWVSWPKKSSGVASEISEDTVREVALPMGFVDVKVCAVDAVWSGLKLVIRKDLR